jgi:glycosyltransferase involved in cell wall biosynthesis
VSGPLVSIVTPSFQQGRFLETTIRSVLEQDYEPIEYVVVDGGSTDESVDVIQRYADRLAWWVSEPDRGQPHAINKGFARATGEYMAYLNSDDTLLPGAISRLAEELARDRDALVAFGDAEFVDEQGRLIRHGQPRVWEVGAMARCGSGSVLQPASLWRREAWELAGPMDEEYQYVFDTLFFLRVAAAGARATYLPEPLATYRIHDESKSARMMETAHGTEVLRFADSYFGGTGLPQSIRPHARAARAAYYRRAALSLYNAGDVGTARKTFLRSLLLRPKMSAQTARYMARTLIPGPLVNLRRRLRG